MPIYAKLQVAVVIDDHQSRRLLHLFSLPEFADKIHLSVLDLQSIRYSLRARIDWLRNKLMRGRSHQETDSMILIRYLMTTYLKNVSVVVALDNQLHLLDDLMRMSDGALRAIAIQMGTNPKYYQRSQTQVIESPVTLLSFGFREVTFYSRGGLAPCSVLPVGSLMRALAARRVVPTEQPMSRYDLCIVSQFRPSPSPKRNPSVSAFKEAESMPTLLGALSPAIERLNLKTIVALRSEKSLSADITAPEEKRCFDDYLTCPFDSTSDKDKFSSYSAIDSSRIVIGRNSALLFEYMASTTRVLFANTTDFEPFNPPNDWIFGLILPSAEEVESKLQLLLGLSSSDYLNQTAETANRYCISSNETIETIRSRILDT